MARKTKKQPGESSKDGASPKIKEVIKLFPNSPDFFGKGSDFSQKTERGLFRRSKRIPELSQYRDALNDDTKNDPGKTQKIRKELSDLVHKFPHSSDLHALKAIQSYQDVQQSGLNESKFSTVESIVHTLGKTITTHSYSLNNLAWFLKIYIHYLDLLKKRLFGGYDIQDLKYSEAKRQLAILHHQAAKSKKEFDSLYTKYEKTSFYSESISTGEIIEAHHALRKGKEKLPIGKFNRPAIVVQLIHMKTNLILSRFPIFSTVIQQNIDSTSEIIHRDVFLLNGMFELNRLLTDYYMLIAMGDKEAQKKKLSELLKKSSDNISYLQENQTLSKEFEFDPLMKFAIVALEVAKFPFSKVYKDSILAQARTGLFKLVNRCHNQAVIRQANKYINEIEALRDQEAEKNSGSTP
ncbi:MAG: hypothetical protein GY866_33205 [Proteobacteria bacterium]|nr:hypothetical protein [Pseudomonadota bacterium]